MGKNSEFIEYIASVEEHLAELYMSFAKKFPRDAFFWKMVAEDQKAQANLIRSFSEDLSCDMHDNMPLFFSEEALNDTQAFLENAAKKEIVSIDDALEIAEFLEKRFLERKNNFDEFFENRDSAKVLKIIERKKMRCAKMISEYREMKRAF